MLKSLISTLIILFALVSISAKWENYKTERVKIAEGVILQKKVNASTGKLISEEYKILIDGNYWDAQFKDGKWTLSDMGADMFNQWKRSGGDSGTGGGGGGCN